MDREALIFLHIPKTAGTTLNRIIEWQYNPVSIFTIDPHGIRATPGRLERLLEQRRRRLQVVRGHMVDGIRKFPPQDVRLTALPLACRIATLLRLPRDARGPWQRPCRS